MSMDIGDDLNPLISVGVVGLDDVLGGGLTPDRVYLLEGNPGAGKTTLSLQFIMEGRTRGEAALYITLSETRIELIAVARSHGWSLDGIEIRELIVAEDELDPDNQHAMFQLSEMELGVTTKAIIEAVEGLMPSRVVIDSLSELRMIAQSSLRYRRQIMALKQFFIGRGCTVLFLDDKTSETRDLQLQSIAHGVLSLEQWSPGYGTSRRRLRVEKLRGQQYRGGSHDFKIVPGGLEVYPRLVASEHDGAEGEGLLTSGIAQMDALVGGGIGFGSSVLMVGPAGSGKSSLACQVARHAAGSGIRAAIFAFDERRQMLFRRCASLGMDLMPLVEAGALTVQQVDPAELSPGEFAHEIRRAVEDREGCPGARVVVIDSLNGYLNAMPDERFLTSQLHELLTYLGNKGVVTFLVVAQHGIVGSQMGTPVDVSYVSDAVVLFRFFEAAGRVRQALSVVKKRIGGHERTIREMRMSGRGIEVGEPLSQFRGILTGTPDFAGTAVPPIGEEDG